MTAARASLRQAVVDALQTIGFDLASPGMWDVPPSLMPACRVRASADAKRGIGKAPPTFDTTVAVQVQVYCEMPTQEDAQKTAEDLSDAVEFSIFTYVPLIDQVSAFSSATTQVEIMTAGAKPVAKIDMTLELLTREQFVRTDFPVLQLLSLSVDFKGGPVDPTGIYIAPPPGDIAAPVPRAAAAGGPDGRVEATILLDMTTGLPPAPTRPRVVGRQVLFPDGSSLDDYRGWNWGRFGAQKESDADLAVQQGARIVRIPLRWWGGSTDPFPGPTGTADSRNEASPATATIDPGHLACLDQMVSWCEARGIYYILFVDSNCGQDGTQPGEAPYCTIDFGGESAWPNGCNFFTNPVMFAKYRKVWQFVGNRYKSGKFWALTEIQPEIGWTTGSSRDIIEFYRVLANDLRQIGVGTPFIVGGLHYNLIKAHSIYDSTASDYVYTGDAFIHAEASPDPITDIDNRVAELVALRDQAGVPIFMQQLGCTTGEDQPDFPYTRACLNSVLSNGIGGTYWELRDANNNANGFGAIYADNAGVDHVKTDYMAIIAQWIAGQAV